MFQGLRASGFGGGAFLSGTGGCRFGFGLGLLGRSLLGFRLSAALLIEPRLFRGCLRGGPLSGLFVCLDLLYRNDAGIFGHLSRFPRIRLRTLAIVTPVEKVPGVLEIDSGLLHGVCGVPVGAGEARNLNRIFRFGELQGTFGSILTGAYLPRSMTYCPRCKSWYLASTCSIVPVVSFGRNSRHNHVARLRHRKIRLGGYNQPEALQVARGEQIGVIALQDDLAQSWWRALRE